MSNENDFADAIKGIDRFLSPDRALKVMADAIRDVPQLRRGRVWCYQCGHTERVNSGDALRHGWPKHCGYTMGIDSPEERKALHVELSK